MQANVIESPILPAPSTQTLRPFIDENGQLRLPFELLQTLSKSSHLISALQDKRLQEVITQIDNSGPLAAEVLDTRLRNDEDFAAFIDILLKEVGLRDQHGASTIDG